MTSGNRKQKRKNLEGKTYGSWQIIRFVELNKHRTPQYHCVCECGKEKVVASHGEKLSSFSCGCQNPGRWRKGSFAPAEDIDLFSTLRARYKKDAKDRGHEFNLSNKEFDNLIIQECFYCGSKQESGQMYNFREMVYYTGIDRVDNSKGYSIENCVPCCKICNNHKKSISKEMIEKAYNFLFGKKDVSE